MSDKKLSELYNQFLTVAKTEGEEAAKKFLTDHFSDFPEEVQKNITLAFFEDALQNKVEEKKNISSIQKEALDTASSIQQMKRVLEDKLRVADLKSELPQ